MKLLLLAAASLAVVSCASLSLEDLEFHAWKLKFGKVYRTPQEESQRKDIWLSTRRRVLAHNILADQGIESYRMGMNHFSDMREEEFHQTVLVTNLLPLNVTRSPPRRVKKSFRHRAGAQLPSSVDWRESGCVTPVKNQGQCGSCWAFSSTGALESHTCIRYGRLISLSEQQLVDCSGSYGNMGCNGGWMSWSFRYIRDNEGIDSEDSYPYEGQESSCRFDTSAVSAVCRGYVYLSSGDEEELKAAVAYLGPVAVAVDAGQESFRSYASGVYYEPQCSSKINHAMLVVGYGTEDGQEYWLVKNSWGGQWGDQGYIKMSRNQRNQCGIASYGIYPEV